ncbi:MAG: FecR domain-containing protein, partial [Bacteroidetes bacterium]|nr:FecR domain-containing protein [Bacteroidota bacterium]
MEKNRFWEILAKVKSGEATPEEQLELSQHLSAFPGDLGMVKQIHDWWELPMPSASAPGENEVTTAWGRLHGKIAEEPLPSVPPAENNKVRSMTKWIAAVAASLVIAIGGGWWWNASHIAPPQKNVVSTRNGWKSKIELPDGTQVWLNVGSRIKYDESYGRENRELTLTGEAYFDVAHDAKRPFILHTGKMDIRVLGTAFNVKAYPGDGVTEAALIKGSIEVTFPGRPQEMLILKPNDKISIVNNEVTNIDTSKASPASGREKPAIMVSSIQYVPADSTIVETAWVNNKLIFRSKPFEEVAKDIERW